MGAHKSKNQHLIDRNSALSELFNLSISSQNGTTQFPFELLCEILSYFKFSELLNIFLLNHSVSNALLHSEHFSGLLCLNYCKCNHIDQQNYQNIKQDLITKQQQLKSHSTTSIANKPLNFTILMKLIELYRYEWDYKFPYSLDDSVYNLNPKSLSVKTVSEYIGEFITVKSTRKLIPKQYYAWKVKLDELNPKATTNRYKIMIGIESLHYFPFNNPSPSDVLGWDSRSVGCALIIGTGEYISNGVGESIRKPQFQKNDVIKVEFDYTNVSEMKYVKENESRTVYGYPFAEAANDLLGRVRFSLIRNDHHKEDEVVLVDWTPFGDARYAPYVPAVSLNVGQSVSIHGNSVNV